MRRSKGALPGFLRLNGFSFRGLKPILFHSTIERAAAQAKGLGGLAHIALKTCSAFRIRIVSTDSRLSSSRFCACDRCRPKPRSAGWIFSAAAHQDSAFQGVLQLANVAGPGILHQGLQGEGSSPRSPAGSGKRMRQEVQGKDRNILTALAQRRQMDFNRIQPEQQVFAKLAGDRQPGDRNS